MQEFPIKIRVPLEKPLRQNSNEEVARGLDAELDQFQQWFLAQGNAGLVKIERSIIRTYLAWKLLYEEGCPASQD